MPKLTQKQLKDKAIYEEYRHKFIKKRMRHGEILTDLGKKYFLSETTIARIVRLMAAESEDRERK
ncbi:MAG: hypothetical protein F9K23_00795 [Bacteroidetes bacterium]|nr:MAG: hypothetical protein F9K23_00795 [Bacteroidota bacterium]